MPAGKRKATKGHMLQCGGKNKDDNGKHTEKLDGKILVKLRFHGQVGRKGHGKHMTAMFEAEKTKGAGTGIWTRRGVTLIKSG